MQTFLKTVLPYVFCILAGYLAGAVNFAWLLAKKRGFDIRTKGSGNAGTTNAGRTMGSGVAAVVFLCDALKSALMVWLAGFLFHSSPSIQTVTMAACVAGHLYPFYLEFQGGKGIAVLLGSALALDWRLFLILVAGVAVITFITDYMFIGHALGERGVSRLVHPHGTERLGHCDHGRHGRAHLLEAPEELRPPRQGQGARHPRELFQEKIPRR